MANLSQEEVFNSLGNGPYLSREALENVKNDKMSFEQWAQYYFSSGQRRQLALSQSPIVSYELKNYFGRTQEEISDWAKDTCNQMDFLSIESEDIDNFGAAFAVDEPFYNYIKINRIQSTLCFMYPELSFRFSDKITYISYGVDLFAYKKDGSEVFAIKRVGNSNDWNDYPHTYEDLGSGREIPIFYAFFSKNVLQTNIDESFTSL